MHDITIKSLEACVLILPMDAFPALHSKDSKTLNFDDQSSGPSLISASPYEGATSK